jgi:hypothetical protein
MKEDEEEKRSVDRPRGRFGSRWFEAKWKVRRINIDGCERSALPASGQRGTWHCQELIYAGKIGHVLDLHCSGRQAQAAICQSIHVKQYGVSTTVVLHT